MRSSTAGDTGRSDPRLGSNVSQLPGPLTQVGAAAADTPDESAGRR